MPGLFSRRRGSSAQPPVNRSTTSAAATAASQAFINRSRANSLSSSAAAAALRSHTTSPEPVGNLVTKRMVRRGSTSSNNGRTASLQGRGGLQRTNSSGSMTERTFRSASPNANSTPAQPATHPPVPSIPKTLRSARAGSTEPPARVFSPPPKNARSASMDQSNRSSLNFSRPRVTSPEPQPQTQPQTQSQKSNTPATKPSSNKNVHTSGGWFAGPVGAASTTPSQKSKPSPIQTAEEMEEVMVYDANSRTFVRSKRPKQPTEPPSPVAPTPALKPGDYDPATRRIVPHPEPVRPPGSRPTMHKQPSMVAEEPEAERAAEESGKSHERSLSLDVPNTRGRGGSLSPSRNARFSASPILTNIMHEPPQRGLSPVKSAMKHSPSSSIRTASPVTTFSPTTQDVSDTTSLTSADGSASGKKRKSVRVSFGDAPPAVKAPEKPDSDDDVDDYSKPRPALPSFGSVRRQESDLPSSEVKSSLPDVPEVSQSVSMPDASKPSIINNIIVPNDPLPPEVTSKTVATHDDDAPTLTDSVPAINLHPPTPGIDETPRELGTDDESTGISDSQEIRSLAQGIVRYGDESDSSSAKEKRPQHVRQSSDADVYSDAPESQDTAAFASLDAIVESPVASPAASPAASPPVSPTKGGNISQSTAQIDTVSQAGTSQSTAQDTSKSGADPVDWSATSAHWNQVNNQAQQAGDEKKSKLAFFKRKKKDPKNRGESPTARPTSPSQPVQDSTSHAVVTPVSETTESKPQTGQEPAHAVSTSVQSAIPAQESIPSAIPAQESIQSAPAQQDAIQPASTPAQQKSTQPASTPASAQPDSTSKSESAPLSSPTASPSKLAKRHSTQPAKSPTVQPAKRHSVQPIKTSQPLKSALKTPTPVEPVSLPKTMRGSGPASVGSPANGRRFSYTTTPTSKLRNDSDSESSFKKKRRSKAQPMRRSMRAGSIDSRPANDSPQMKQSLRGAPRGKAFKSRLADSDSEDDRPAYQSRFADSDDDTILEELPPVRGIPRRKGQEDGDSTDLEDESDAERSKIVINPADVEKAMDLARKKLGMDTRDRDQDKVLISDVMSDAGSESTKRRRSFLRILNRNRNSSQSIPQSPPPVPQLKRGVSTFSTATAPARTEDWPLPSMPQDSRPQTSDDGLHSERTPERPQNRRSFSARVGFTDEAIAHSEKPATADAIISQRTGRKKKFGLLRRAFGLYD